MVSRRRWRVSSPARAVAITSTVNLTSEVRADPPRQARLILDSMRYTAYCHHPPPNGRVTVEPGGTLPELVQHKCFCTDFRHLRPAPTCVVHRLGPPSLMRRLDGPGPGHAHRAPRPDLPTVRTATLAPRDARSRSPSLRSRRRFRSITVRTTSSIPRAMLHPQSRYGTVTPPRPFGLRAAGGDRSTRAPPGWRVLLADFRRLRPMAAPPVPDRPLYRRSGRVIRRTSRRSG